MDRAVTRRAVLRKGAIAGGSALAAGALFSTPKAKAATGVAAVPNEGPSAECATVYAGYQPADWQQPWARFWKGHTIPPQAVIGQALAAGPLPASQIPPLSDLGADMANPGYGNAETGYGMLSNGQLYVATLTQMPGVRPEMWDWWFGWHSDHSSKYKLWHPDAHRFAALQNDLVGVPGLTDKQRYINNISFVDEFIGSNEQQLSINFVDPTAVGVNPASFNGTAICAHVGSTVAPLNIAMLCHQVRVTAQGSEMRSRFYLNVYSDKTVDTHAAGCASQRPVQNQGDPPFNLAYGAALMTHCGSEMNHLAQFLPEIYAQFGDPSQQPLDLAVNTHNLTVGHKTRLHFLATAGGAGVPDVNITVNGKTATTNRAGQVTLTVTPGHSGNYHAIATRPGGTGAKLSLKAKRPGKHHAQNH